jgi:hypothetical protein
LSKAAAMGERTEFMPQANNTACGCDAGARFTPSNAARRST